MRIVIINKHYFLVRLFFQTLHDTELQDAARSVLRVWWENTGKRKQKKKSTIIHPGYFSTLEKYALGLERYVNVLLHSPHTRGIYNLAAHTWIQMRGMHNASQGYMPNRSNKISQKEKSLAGIFSKLWFETNIFMRQPDYSVLKPFPAMMASVALQVGKWNLPIYLSFFVIIKNPFIHRLLL